MAYINLRKKTKKQKTLTLNIKKDNMQFEWNVVAQVVVPCPPLTPGYGPLLHITLVTQTL